jgi:hypothetical protein
MPLGLAASLKPAIHCCLFLLDLQDTVATLCRKFEAVRRELLQASPEEYARLEGRDRSGAALPTTTVSNVDELIREVQQQKAVQQQTTGVKHNILPSPGLTGRKPAVVKEDTRPEGTGEEIMLQGFNWDRCGGAAARLMLHTCLAVVSLALVDDISTLWS